MTVQRSGGFRETPLAGCRRSQLLRCLGRSQHDCSRFSPQLASRVAGSGGVRGEKNGHLWLHGRNFTSWDRIRWFWSL